MAVGSRNPLFWVSTDKNLANVFYTVYYWSYIYIESLFSNLEETREALTKWTDVQLGNSKYRQRVKIT
jgi:hypothetical protein